MADDTRVVQMQFNNRAFERNIAQSQSSLEKFKKSLNFEAVGKGLAKFGDSLKNLAFDTLNDNIQKLTDKFTGLGDTGEWVLSRIRASLQGAALDAERFAKSLTLEQINVGQNKYDALTRSVQTIVANGMATEEKAYSVMERVSAYTDQTSHSFETMVAQISTLTSIGVPIEYAEKLVEAFGNASTKAGADASHAAIAMQTYSKAMGSFLTKNEFDTLNLTAKVVTKEWRDGLIEAGIAAGDLVKDTKGVVKTAKKYGKQIIVTADNVENSLNKKWAGKKTLSLFGEKYMFGETVEDLAHPEKVMDSFGKQAYLTGQRALTFADALNAVKESISGGWMNTFRLIFGDLTDAMNLWTGACNKVIDALSGIAEARNAVLERWNGLGGRDSLISLVFGEIIDADGNTLYEGAYGLLDIMTDIGNLISDGFWSMIQLFLPDSIYNESIDTWGTNTTYMFDALGWMLKEFTDNIRNAIANLKTFFNEKPEGSDITRWEQIRQVVMAVFTTIGFIGKVIEGLIYFFGLIGDQLSPSTDKIGNLFSTLAGDVKDSETDIVRGGKIKKFFDDLAETLKPFTDMINDVVGAFTELILAITSSEQVEAGANKGLKDIWQGIKDTLATIVSILRPFVDFIVEIMGIVSDLFHDGFTDQNVEVAKKKAKDAFTKLITALKLVLTPIFESVVEWVKGKVNEIIKKISDYFSDKNTIGYKLLQPLKKLFEFLRPVWTLLKNVWDKIISKFFGQNGKLQGPTLFDSLKMIFMSSGVNNLFKKLKDLAKDGGLYKLLMGALGVYSIWQIIKAVKTIGGFFADVGGNLKAGVLGTYEWFSERIQGIAKGLLMLAAAVAILGTMDTGSVTQGLIALGVIMLEFVGFMKLMDTINAATITKQAAMTGMISIFCAAIAVLVLALLPFAFVSWEGFARMIVGLGLVLLELIGFMELMKVLELKCRFKRFSGIAVFAVAVAILMVALIPFMIADWQAMLRGVAGLAIVLGELIGFMVLLKKLDLAGTGLHIKGIGLFALAVAILMLSLIPFMIADWQAALRGVLGLAVVLGELLVFMLLLKKFTIASDALQFTGIVAFAFAIDLLMLALLPFMLTSWEGMLRAVIGLGVILLEIIGFMRLMQKLQLSTLGLNFTGIRTFMLSIAILMVSLIPFMLTDWEGMLRAVLGLGLVLAEIIGFMKLFWILNLSTKALNFTGIIAFSVAIAILILAVKSFASMDWEGWIRALGGLAIMMGEILAFMALAQGLTYNATAIGMVIAICLSIGVMALLLSMAMNEIRNLKWETVTAFTAGMSVLLLAMAGAIAILSAIPFTAGLKGIALIGLAIAALVGVIALVGPMLVNAMGDTFARLSGKLEMISGLLKGFSDRMGEIDSGNISKAENIFDQLRKMIQKLSGWGKFNGDLDNFSYSMFVLGTGMEIFNNHVGNVAGDINSNAKTALEFIQDLSSCASDLDTISKMNMDSLTAKISGLGGAMYLFAKGAEEVSGTSMTETPDVSGAVAVLKEISKALAGDDGKGIVLPENLPEADEFSTFGASIAALALALVEFEKAGSNLGNGTNQALKALDFFVDIKRKLLSADFMTNLATAIGIFDSNDVDKNKLSEFGGNIEQLGLALASFNKSVTVVDEVTGEVKPIDFSSAISTLDSLVDLQNKLGWDFGPLIQFFAGRRKDFYDLGGEIEALGTALSDFNTKLVGVDESGNKRLDPELFNTAIEVTDQVVDYLNKLKEKMDPVGGLFRAIGVMFGGHSYTFTDIKKQMQDLAEGVGSLGQLKVDKKLLTVDETKGIFEALDLVIDYLLKVKEKMGNVGGIINDVKVAFVGREYNFTDLKTQLTALGDGLKGLSVFEVKDLPAKEELEAAFPMIDSLIDYMNTLKDKVSENEGSVGGLYNGINTALHGRKFNFEDLKTQLTSLGDGLNAIANVKVDSNGKSIFNEEGRGAALNTIDALIDYMVSLEGKLGKVGGIAAFFKNMWEGHDADFQYIGTQLGFLGDGLGKFQVGITKNGKFNASDTSKALGALDHLVSMMQTFSVLTQSMDSISQSYHLSSYTTQGLINNMVNALFQMTDVVELDDHAGPSTVVAQLANFVHEFDYQLGQLGNLQNKDSIDILNNVATALYTLVHAARDMQIDNKNTVDFKIVGENISNGIALGIANATNVVEAAARAVVVAAKNAANAEAEINSPSRVFAEIGSYMSRGMAVGFMDEQRTVEKASEGVTENVINIAEQAMADFAALMSQEIDSNPTITPVLDLTNITAGSDAINRLLQDGATLGLTGANLNFTPQTVDFNQNGTQSVNYTDSINQVRGEISDMRRDLQNLSQSMSNLKLVMNTGAVVGAIGPEMDEYLGKAGFYSSRI